MSRKRDRAWINSCSEKGKVEPSPSCLPSAVCAYRCTPAWELVSHFWPLPWVLVPRRWAAWSFTPDWVFCSHLVAASCGVAAGIVHLLVPLIPSCGNACPGNKEDWGVGGGDPLHGKTQEPGKPAEVKYTDPEYSRIGIDMVESPINRRFARLRLLGEGAAAQVFEAAVVEECPYARVGDLVAIKSYKPWVLAQTGQALHVERELVASTKVDSEHIVKSYEVVKDESGMFLVMELLRGTTLSEWMRDNPLPTFASISRITRELAEAIFALHDKGLIHRDVKPDNVMITSRGAVLMDLGVVKDQTAATTMTHRRFLGTIRYAAPEYLFGEPYDQGIDVYSLDAILHELVFRKLVIDPELYWSRQILKAGG